MNTVTLARPASSLSAPRFEQFRCYGTPERPHSSAGRILVEVDWERRLIRKKCDQCNQWHVLTSQETRGAVSD